MEVKEEEDNLEKEEEGRNKREEKHPYGNYFLNVQNC